MDIRRTTEYCKELEDLTIIIEPHDDLKDLGLHNLLVKVINDLDGIDCYIIGDEFCLSNSDCGYNVYCANTDRIYTLSVSSLMDIQSGVDCRLYPHKLDDDDRELVNSYFGD